MKRHVVLIIALAVFLAVVLGIVCFAAISAGTISLSGGRVYEIQTDSMSPTFEAGDRIYCVKVEDPADLRAGDIITYWTVINGQRVLNTHRIVEIYDGGGYLIFATKGDNNTQVDPLTVHEDDIVGQYSFKLPF